MVAIPSPVSHGRLLGGERTEVMGILNVTPDSFSDGGLWLSADTAIDHGLRMADEGAFMVDVGGESTRPGARRVNLEEEWERVGAVIAGLVRRGVRVSIDTVHAETARRALEEGAELVNDVSGGTYDPALVEVAANDAAALVIQHWRGFPSDPTLNQTYAEVVSEVTRETDRQISRALERGVARECLVIDPGLGFAKGSEDSWTLLENLDAFVATGLPVLVGASRKRFVAARFPDDLERGTLRTTRMAVEAGTWAVRVHDVARNVDLIDRMGREG